jgi:hypothetical protein
MTTIDVQHVKEDEHEKTRRRKQNGMIKMRNRLQQEFICHQSYSMIALNDACRQRVTSTMIKRVPWHHWRQIQREKEEEEEVEEERNQLHSLTAFSIDSSTLCGHFIDRSKRGTRPMNGCAESRFLFLFLPWIIERRRVQRTTPERHRLELSNRRCRSTLHWSKIRIERKEPQ